MDWLAANAGPHYKQNAKALTDYLRIQSGDRFGNRVPCFLFVSAVIGLADG